MAEFQCPECERSFTTKKGLAVHTGMMHKGDKNETGERTSDVDVGTRRQADGEAEEAFEYPQLGDLPSMDEEEEAESGTMAAEEDGEVSDEAETVAKAKPEPVRLELSKLWEMMGNFIDKDDPLSEKEIQALNDSLNSLGLATLPTDDPIVVPNWLPVVLTIVSVFGMRLLNKYGSEIIGNIKDKLLSKKSMVVQDEEDKKKEA